MKKYKNTVILLILQLVKNSLRVCHTSTQMFQCVRGHRCGRSQEVSQTDCWPLSRCQGWKGSALLQSILAQVSGRKETQPGADSQPWVWCFWSVADAQLPCSLECTETAVRPLCGIWSSCRSIWGGCKSWQTWRRGGWRCWLCLAHGNPRQTTLRLLRMVTRPWWKQCRLQ